MHKVGLERIESEGEVPGELAAETMRILKIHQLNGDLGWVEDMLLELKGSKKVFDLSKRWRHTTNSQLGLAWRSISHGDQSMIRDEYPGMNWVSFYWLRVSSAKIDWSDFSTDVLPLLE